MDVRQSLIDIASTMKGIAGNDNIETVDTVSLGRGGRFDIEQAEADKRIFLELLPGAGKEELGHIGIPILDPMIGDSPDYG